MVELAATTENENLLEFFENRNESVAKTKTKLLGDFSENWIGLAAKTENDIVLE